MYMYILWVWPTCLWRMGRNCAWPPVPVSAGRFKDPFGRTPTCCLGYWVDSNTMWSPTAEGEHLHKNSCPMVYSYIKDIASDSVSTKHSVVFLSLLPPLPYSHHFLINFVILTPVFAVYTIYQLHNIMLIMTHQLEVWIHKMDLLFPTYSDVREIC